MRGIGMVAALYRASQGQWTEEFLLEHTPFNVMFCMSNQYDKQMARQKWFSKEPVHYSGKKNFRLNQIGLRYVSWCPLCLKEQRQQLGECYISRLTQGVLNTVCPGHGCRLRRLHISYGRNIYTDILTGNLKDEPVQEVDSRFATRMSELYQLAYESGDFIIDQSKMVDCLMDTLIRHNAVRYDNYHNYLRSLIATYHIVNELDRCFETEKEIYRLTGISVNLATVWFKTSRYDLSRKLYGTYSQYLWYAAAIMYVLDPKIDFKSWLNKISIKY